VDWQQLISLAIVAATGAAFVWARLRRRRFRFERDAPCGCSSSGDPTRSSIVYRARKGERPEVIVKMR